jgi:hypothetical protein
MGEGHTFLYLPCRALSLFKLLAVWRFGVLRLCPSPLLWRRKNNFKPQSAKAFAKPF